MTNGDTYQGQFEYGVRKGFGKYTHKSNGQVKEGRWKNNRLIHFN